MRGLLYAALIAATAAVVSAQNYTYKEGNDVTPDEKRKKNTGNIENDYAVFEDFEWNSDAEIRELEIENVNGGIHITVAPAPVTVKAKKAAISEEYMAGIAINVEETGGVVSITTDLPKDKQWRQKREVIGRVDYEVTVPETATVTADLANGNVVIEGVNKVNVSLANGDVDISRAYEAVVVSLANGKVTVANGEKPTKSIDVETANGAVDIDVKLPESGGKYDIETATGDVTVNLIGGAENLDFEAGTITGDVTADFALQADTGWVGGTYSAKFGDGGNSLKIGVVTGKVKINTK